jgi:hypothetical protein
MKSILLFTLIGFLFQPSSTIFNGVLKYESDYDMGGSVGKVLTTIYESDSKGRVESKNIQTKSPIGDPKTKDQDVILYDFAKLQETHLQTITSRAITSPYTEILIQQSGRGSSIINDTKIEVQNMGTEKIGQYNCTHFLVTKTNPKLNVSNPAKSDIWVTNDLGSSNLWYVGSYLYYPEGSPTQKKLADAGIGGVVVKWHTGSGDLQASGMLVSYEKKTLSPATFTPPSNFTTN